MRCFVASVAFAFALVPSISFAQSVLLHVDLSQYGAMDADPVDDDGNPATRAWLLIKDLDAAQPELGQPRQLLVMRADGSLCAESPFFVPNLSPSAKVSIAHDGRRDVLKVISNLFTITTVNGQWVASMTPLTFIALDRNRCR